ncbi:MAG: sensor domain-containing diguanylate cyclase [Aquihabitans sp.]
MSLDVYQDERRREWLSALDACLLILADQRLLDEVADTLLDNVLLAFDTPHAYLHIADSEGPIRAIETRGCWADGPPLDLHTEVCSRRETLRFAGGDHGIDGPVAAAPVYWQDEVVGTLGVGFTSDHMLASRSDLDELVTRFATIVAAAYSNSRLVVTERIGRREEEALLRAGQALSVTLHLRDVLSTILDELRNVVPYDTASVQELRDGQMVIVGGHGIDMDVFDGIGFDALTGGVPNSEVLRTNAPVIVSDILGDHPYWEFPHNAHEMSGVRCWLGVPLMFGSHCIGMLTLDTYQPNFYTDAHAKTALAFAAQAAIALQNARSFDRTRQEVIERRRAEADLRSANAILKQRMAEIEALQVNLREQAIRDPLTGLFNRRYLMENLQREVHRSERSREPLSVALIDVDHFKEVNDTLGHDAGDQVLVRVGHFLEAQVRDSDVVCRYGGEEFVVVMPDTPSAVAAKRAEEWRAAIEDMAILNGTPRRPVTISVGVTTSPDHAATSQDLVRAADEAMYEAKRQGRNQVVTAN